MAYVILLRTRFSGHGLHVASSRVLILESVLDTTNFIHPTATDRFEFDTSDGALIIEKSAFVHTDDASFVTSPVLSVRDVSFSGGGRVHFTIRGSRKHAERYGIVRGRMAARVLTYSQFTGMYRNPTSTIYVAYNVRHPGHEFDNVRMADDLLWLNGDNSPMNVVFRNSVFEADRVLNLIRVTNMTMTSFVESRLIITRGVRFDEPRTGLVSVQGDTIGTVYFRACQLEGAPAIAGKAAAIFYQTQPTWVSNSTFGAYWLDVSAPAPPLVRFRWLWPMMHDRSQIAWTEYEPCCDSSQG